MEWLVEAITLEDLVDGLGTIGRRIVRCKDCKHKPSGTEDDMEFPDGICPCQCEDYWYSWMPKDDFFCAWGEREEDD